MNSQVSETGSASIVSPELSPEILLSIFLTLTSEEIVSLRRVCNKWLDVIDTNKLLWRNLEWKRKSAESFKKAVEMFDQKSSSSLEMVSIKDRTLSSNGLQQLVGVMSQCTANLKSLSILTFRASLIIGPLLDLANSSPNLEKLVLWDAQKESLPLARLVSTSKRFDGDSSASPLKVLWLISSSSGDIKQILDLPTLKSLVSFVLHGARYFQELRPLLARFSETIVLLRLSIKDGGSQTEQPLFCPNLKILEGNFPQGPQFYFDCPILTHLVLSFETRTRLHGIPSSVEQLWLKSSGQSVPVKVWEPLLRSCPNIKVLRLERFEDIRDETLRPGGLIQVLEKRQEMINKGEEIQGLPVVPLQKLVLSLNRLSQIQLDRARKVAGEVVDIQDYPNFIELEY